MKKLIKFGITVLALCLLMSMTAFAADAAFDKGKLSSGVIGVTYNGDMSKPIKVMVEKGGEKYTYTIKSAGTTYFPLQLGAGSYKVTVLQNVEGTKYAALASETVDVGEVDPSALYTQSIQLVDYSPSMAAIQNSQGLAASAGSTGEKLDAIYQFMVDNFKYDFDKYSTLSSDYVPVIDQVYNAKSGICYDYSSLFAAQLREQGIPTKLQMGYFTEVEAYHAWNEAFIDGQWQKIDTTYDAQAKSYGVEFSKFKNSGDFKVVKVY